MNELQMTVADINKKYNIMSEAEKNRAKIKADNINKEIQIKRNKRGEFNSLGKDSFLKLLITQLQHQNPIEPMDNTAFISQMAQFSSLEQMTNINKEMRSLIKSSRSSEAFALLGKRIDAFNQATKKGVSGVVSSIQYKDEGFLLMVGNKEVSINDIHAVYNINDKNEKTGDTVLKN